MDPTGRRGRIWSFVGLTVSVMTFCYVAVLLAAVLVESTPDASLLVDGYR